MTAIDLNLRQLMMLRSLSRGWPDDLLDKLPLRCGAEPGDWPALVEAGLVELEKNGRWRLTKTGRREYNGQRRGRWF